MIIASDVTTLKERGKYNGFIGASVALGNGIGPLIGGAVTEKASWQWCMWFIVPFILCVMILLALVIPKSRVSGDIGTKLKMIDWAGLLINIAAVLLVLVSFQDCELLQKMLDKLCDDGPPHVSLIRSIRYLFPWAVRLLHGTARLLSPCLPLVVP